MSESMENSKTINIQGKTWIIAADHPIRVACLEHVERELDDYVNIYEVAPDTFSIDEVDDSTLDKTCQVCGAPGKIVLMHVKGS